LAWEDKGIQLNISVTNGGAMAKIRAEHLSSTFKMSKPDVYHPHFNDTSIYVFRRLMYFEFYCITIIPIPPDVPQA
jgi:hypothetical protein